MVILVNYWENDGSISENCRASRRCSHYPSVEEEKFHHGHSVPHISHQKSGSYHCQIQLKWCPPVPSWLIKPLVPSPINPTVSLDQMTYNVGPPSDVCWFINPNYSYLRTINHSEIGVMCTNFSRYRGRGPHRSPTRSPTRSPQRVPGSPGTVLAMHLSVGFLGRSGDTFQLEV